jgi:hypothetical protein
MRRLYIASLDIVHEHAMLGIFPSTITTHWLALYDPAVPGDEDRWKASGCPVVLTTDITGEYQQDLWENHPGVTVLPDPVWDGTMPIADATEMPENANTPSVTPVDGQTGSEKVQTPVGFRGVGEAGGTRKVGYMLDAATDAPTVTVCEGVEHLVAANLGVQTTDTVVDVHRKLMTVHPAFKLRSR